MSTVIRRNYLERLLYRSFLESSPPHTGMPRKLPVSETSFRRHGHIDLHQLKLNLLQSAFETTSNARLYERLCGAANRAAELAWATPYPLLVFPCLFEEMVEEIHASPKQTADDVHCSSEAVQPYDVPRSRSFERWSRRKVGVAFGFQSDYQTEIAK